MLQSHNIMASSSSSSSSRPIKHQVFLSSNPENKLDIIFICDLASALRDIGMNVVSFDKRLGGGQFSAVRSQVIAASNLSIVILSKDYASSRLPELCDIMDRRETRGQIVFPIFYHVDSTDVKNICGSFKRSFEEHESKRPVDEVKRWKTSFAEVGKLKGWHIKGGEDEKPEIEYIKDIVDYVKQKLMKPRVFLSFRDEDTRYNFTSHLYEALKGKGLDVFFDEETLEEADWVSQSCSNAITASNISIVVLSEEYASSESCLAELSDIMDHKRAQGHIVLPIFYHVDPSLVRNIGGNFKTSFEEHESNRPVDEVKRWKSAFVELGNLKGWHIGGKFDRSKIEHIKDIVEYVIQKLHKPQVFLSFRGEDTRLNFTSHLLKSLKDEGINVFVDEEKLENREQLSQAISQAIVASNLSLIVLSVNYASSKSCLVELTDIMDRHLMKQQTVFPIFYHINPSDVRNLGGRFKTSFDDYESKRLYQVHRWKAAFANVGKLKGWHIEGGKFDKPETDYIKDIVEYVAKKLNSKSISASKELVEEEEFEAE